MVCNVSSSRLVQRILFAVLAWCDHSPQSCIVGFYTYVMCLNTHTSWYHTVLVMMSQRVVPQGWSSTATHCSCLQRAERQTGAYGSDENGQPLNSEQHKLQSVCDQRWPFLSRHGEVSWCEAEHFHCSDAKLPQSNWQAEMRLIFLVLTEDEYVVFFLLLLLLRIKAWKCLKTFISTYWKCLKKERNKQMALISKRVL